MHSRCARPAIAATTVTAAQHDHINFYGTYSFDIDAELRREGHRPLRIPA